MTRGHIDLMPLDEAQRRFFDALDAVGFFAAPEECVPARRALGRITSRPARARRPVPHFRSAAMDGVAVVADRTTSASPETPIRLQEPQDFVYVDTGDVVPAPFDAVIKIEDVRQLEPGLIEVERPIASGKNLRTIGEDVQKGEIVVPETFKVTPEAVAALLNAGAFDVWVKRQLRAMYFPTGSELVSPMIDLRPGQLPESNSQIVSGYLRQWGCVVDIGPIIPDDRAALRSALGEAAAECDLVLVGGGTSMGREDLTGTVISELGRVLVHGVAYHPGHPVVLGLVGEKPAIGLPGYPVASWVALHLFVRPLIERYYGLAFDRPPIVEGRLAETIRSAPGAVEFVRVRLEPEADGWRVIKLRGGASRLSSLIRADGILEVPADVRELPAGTRVRVRLLKTLS
ncbi:MAG: molybdopterin molybdenumtransferase MoeA [Acidobacteria bacterium]|nr:MAG: molybdopterin molybdenumtransferase MoeA [Acidobacteriota bacterium]